MNESVALTMVAAACGWALFLYATSQAAKAQAKGVLSWLKAAAWGALAVIGVGLGLTPMTARAADYLHGKFPNGAEVELHKDGGTCPMGKKRAVWISPQKDKKIGGCYEISSSMVVMILWDDGDRSEAWVSYFKPADGV